MSSSSEKISSSPRDAARPLSSSRPRFNRLNLGYTRLANHDSVGIYDRLYAYLTGNPPLKLRVCFANKVQVFLIQSLFFFLALRPPSLFFSMLSLNSLLFLLLIFDDKSLSNLNPKALAQFTRLWTD